MSRATELRDAASNEETTMELKNIQKKEFDIKGEKVTTKYLNLHLKHNDSIMPAKLKLEMEFPYGLRKEEKEYKTEYIGKAVFDLNDPAARMIVETDTHSGKMGYVPKTKAKIQFNDETGENEITFSDDVLEVYDSVKQNNVIFTVNQGEPLIMMSSLEKGKWFQVRTPGTKGYVQLMYEKAASAIFNHKEELGITDIVNEDEARKMVMSNNKIYYHTDKVTGKETGKASIYFKFLFWKKNGNPNFARVVLADTKEELSYDKHLTKCSFKAIVVWDMGRWFVKSKSVHQQKTITDIIVTEITKNKRSNILQETLDSLPVNEERKKKNLSALEEISKESEEDEELSPDETAGSKPSKSKGDDNIDDLLNSAVEEEVEINLDDDLDLEIPGI